MNLYNNVEDLKVMRVVRSVTINGEIMVKLHSILQYAKHSFLSFILQDVFIVFVLQNIVSLSG